MEPKSSPSTPKPRSPLSVDTSQRTCERVLVALTPSGLEFKFETGEEDFRSAVDLDESDDDEDPRRMCTDIALGYLRSIEETGERQKLKVVEKIRKAGSRLKEKTNNARFVRQRDKFAFILGFLGNIYGFYTLGGSKCDFYQFYTLMLVLLLAIRFFVYRFKRLHYYLLEFCYYGNLMFLIHLWFYPQSETLYVVCFAFSMGPLAFATIVLNNSLVPHSIDKQTSTFIHVMPALTTWAVRWEPCSAMLPTTQTEVSLALYLLFCGTLYLVWAISYYVKVFVVSNSKVVARDYETSYILIMRRPGSVPFRLVTMLGQSHGPFVYMSLHFCYFFTTTLISYLCYRSYYVHTVVAFGVYVWSVWNGANYYMDYFSKHYEESLKHLEEMSKHLS